MIELKTIPETNKKLATYNIVIPNTTSGVSLMTYQTQTNEFSHRSTSQ